MAQNSQNKSNVEVQTSMEKEGDFIDAETKSRVAEIISSIEVSESDINVLLGKRRGFLRVTLLRHFPYIEEAKEIEKKYNELYKKKKKGEPYDEKELLRLSKKLDSSIYKDLDNIPNDQYVQYKSIVQTLLGSSGLKVLAFYSGDDGIQRCKITGENLFSIYKGEGLTYNEITLKGSNKENSNSKTYTELPRELHDEIIRLIRGSGDSQDIIVIGNRAYSHGFDDIRQLPNTSRIESVNNFESRGYAYGDIDSKGEFLPESNEFIIVHPENYGKLFKFFPITHSSIIDFQNKLNTFFLKSHELFEKYSESTQEDLRDFCIFNLIKLGKIEALNRIFRNKETSENIRKRNYKNLTSQQKVVLEYCLRVYPKVIETKSRSLDPRIKEGQDIDPHFNFSDEKYDIDILELLKSGKPIKYIEGKAGAGKSYLLSHIAENLNRENIVNIQLGKEYYPVYINLSGKGIDVINEVTQEVYNTYQVVYLIDSIDESHIYGEDRKKLDEKLLELSKGGKVIITSRNGYLINYVERNKQEKAKNEKIKLNQDIIEIKDLTKEYVVTYLIKYFGEGSVNIEKTLLILEKLNGVGNNPLILSMLCELVGIGKLEDEEGNYVQIENITLSILYYNIVKKRLLDWNKDISFRDISNEEFFGKMLNGLSKIAYEQIIEGKTIISMNLLKILGSKNTEVFKQDVEGINLLFKKGEEYDFIHQSFKEYFSARYIFEAMKSPDFDYEYFLCQQLKKVDLNFLEMLCQLLKADEESKNRFVKALNENENYYPNIVHYKIIYLLGFFDIGKRNRYKKHIDNIDYKKMGLLGLINNEYYIDEQFTIKNERVRASIEQQYGAGGKKYVLSLRSNIHNLDFKIRSEAVYNLFMIGGKGNLNIIKKLFNSKHEGIRKMVTSTLYGIKRGIVIDFVKSYIGSKYEDIRVFVVEFLGKTGLMRDIALIKPLINDPSWIVRKRVLDVIGEIGGEENIDLIRSKISDEDENVRIKVIDILLSKGGKDNIDLIRALINDTSYIVRIKVIEALGELGGEENATLIYPKINDTVKIVRNTATLTLIEIGGEKYISFIKEKINDVDEEVCSSAIVALGELGGEENFSLIRMKINDSRERVRYRSMRILGRFGSQEDLELVKSKLINEEQWIKNDLFGYLKSHNKI